MPRPSMPLAEPNMPAESSASPSAAVGLCALLRVAWPGSQAHRWRDGTGDRPPSGPPAGSGHRRSTAKLIDVMGDQARQTAYTLSMAARRPCIPATCKRCGSWARICSRPATFSSSLSTTPPARTSLWPAAAQLRTVGPPLPFDASMSRRSRASTASLNAPGRLPRSLPARSQPGIPGSSRLMGYVSVGISPAQEQSQVQRVNYFALGIGCVTVLITLPLSYLLVHRMFLPIRQLVDATNRIAAGDLDTAVAIDRSDAIGDLARSFNAMIQTVKRQQQDLRDINDDLEQKVIQRTAQLETANQSAQQRNRREGRFPPRRQPRPQRPAAQHQRHGLDAADETRRPFSTRKSFTACSGFRRMWMSRPI